MTPTAEMVAMAERIAENHIPDGYCSTHAMTLAFREISQNAALNAIMEVSDKVSSMADGRRTDDGSLWDAAMEDFGDAIRNGEHLR